MSKRFIGLLIATVIFLTASLLVAESKKIEQPILIPLGQQWIQEQNTQNYFSLSYITNRNEPLQIQTIRIGEDYLYPQSEFGFGFFVGDQMTNLTRINSYRYYDLHEQQFMINDFQIPNIKQHLQNNQTVKVEFSNGTQIDYPLALYFAAYQPDEQRFTTNESSENKDGVTENQFIVNEAGTIEAIKSTFTDATITLYSAEQQLTLPYEAKKDEKLTIHITPNMNFIASHGYNLYITGHFATRGPISEILFSQTSNYPDEKWIENYIKKVGGK